jgi:hypothetical protein
VLRRSQRFRVALPAQNRFFGGTGRLRPFGAPQESQVTGPGVDLSRVSGHQSAEAHGNRQEIFLEQTRSRYVWSVNSGNSLPGQQNFRGCHLSFLLFYKSVSLAKVPSSSATSLTSISNKTQIYSQRLR